MADNVNHPQHYADSCSIECIDAMIVAFGYEYMYNYCLINAFKYIWRHKNKNGFEDIKKAAWYLNKADELYLEWYHESASSDDSFKHLTQMVGETTCWYTDQLDPNKEAENKIKEEIIKTNERILNSKEYQEYPEGDDE